jgi:TRAP-type C4-dicarboxylate transport system permease small subunit
MNIGIPTSSPDDIASSTSSYIGAFSGVAILICGILLALFVIERLIDNFTAPHTAPKGDV